MGKAVRHVFWAVVLVACALTSWRPALRLFYPFPYAGIVENAAAAYELDPLLLAAIMRTESRYNPEAVSPRGARGLMQIMPDTATWAAENIPLPDFGLDELGDPTVNVTIAAWYFRFLLDHFHGRVAVSLAAYNAGPGTVQGWLETGVWSGALREVEAIPYGETREYVRRVVQAYRLYRRLYSSSHQGHQGLLQ